MTPSLPSLNWVCKGPPLPGFGAEPQVVEGGWGRIPQFKQKKGWYGIRGCLDGLEKARHISTPEEQKSHIGIWKVIAYTPGGGLRGEERPP